MNSSYKKKKKKAHSPKGATHILDKCTVLHSLPSSFQKKKKKKEETLKVAGGDQESVGPLEVKEKIGEFCYP